jgi:hypothetical protein
MKQIPKILKITGTSIGSAIALFAGIVQISGFSLREIFNLKPTDKATPEITDTLAVTPKVDTVIQVIVQKARTKSVPLEKKSDTIAEPKPQPQKKETFEEYQKRMKEEFENYKKENY